MPATDWELRISLRKGFLPNKYLLACAWPYLARANIVVVGGRCGLDVVPLRTAGPRFVRVCEWNYADAQRLRASLAASDPSQQHHGTSGSPALNDACDCGSIRVIIPPLGSVTRRVNEERAIAPVEIDVLPADASQARAALVEAVRKACTSNDPGSAREDGNPTGVLWFNGLNQQVATLWGQLDELLQALREDGSLDASSVTLPALVVTVPKSGQATALEDAKSCGRRCVCVCAGVFLPGQQH